MKVIFINMISLPNHLIFKNMNKLHTFGCSYTQDFIDNKIDAYIDYCNFRGGTFPLTWSEVLSSKLNFSLKNYGRSGGGNNLIFQTLCNNIEKIEKGDLASFDSERIKTLKSWKLPLSAMGLGLSFGALGWLIKALCTEEGEVTYNILKTKAETLTDIRPGEGATQVLNRAFDIDLNPSSSPEEFLDAVKKIAEKIKCGKKCVHLTIKKAKEKLKLWINYKEVNLHQMQLRYSMLKLVGTEI